MVQLISTNPQVIAPSEQHQRQTRRFLLMGDRRRRHGFHRRKWALNHFGKLHAKHLQTYTTYNTYSNLH